MFSYAATQEKQAPEFDQERRLSRPDLSEQKNERDTAPPGEGSSLLKTQRRFAGEETRLLCYDPYGGLIDVY